MGSRLAELFVEIGGRTGGLESTLARVRGMLGGMGTVALAAGGAVAGGLAIGAYKALQGASDLNETLSRTRAILGPAADEVIGQANRMSAAFGTSKDEYLSAATSFAAVFKQMGKSQAEAAALGNQMAQLGMDMASFSNTSNADAFAALSSALRGEMDPIERYGVFLKAGADKMAILARITEQTADAQGDLARTAEQPANQLRKIGGEALNLATDLGTTLMPAFSSFLGAAGEGFAILRGGFDALRPTLDAIVAQISGAYDVVAVMGRNWSDVFAIVQLKAEELFTNFGILLEWLPGAAGATLSWFAENWTGILSDAFNAGLTIAQNAMTNMMAIIDAAWEYVASGGKSGFDVDFKPLLDGFEATVTSLPDVARPALMSLQSEIDKVADRMGAREAERMAKKMDEAAKLSAKAGDDAAKREQAAGGDGKFQSFGLEEFQRSLQEGVFGKDDAAKRTAAGVGQLVELQKEQLDETKKAAKKGPGLAVAG